MARPALVHALEGRVREAHRLGLETERLKAELARQRERTHQIHRTNALLAHQMAEQARKKAERLATGSM
eukprot:907119-Pyramimonas_sp.AAC.1